MGWTPFMNGEAAVEVLTYRRHGLEDHHEREICCSFILVLLLEIGDRRTFFLFRVFYVSSFIEIEKKKKKLKSEICESDVAFFYRALYIYDTRAGGLLSDTQLASCLLLLLVAW